MKEDGIMNEKRFDEKQLYETIESIPAPDREAVDLARARQEKLAKPPGSLGGLEDLSIKMAGITGQVKNKIEKGCVVVLCADNGVAEENVASAPQSVTMAQTINFTRRLTGVGALAESFGSELLIVDLGVKDTIPAQLYDTIPLRDTHKIVDRRLRQGTDNLAKGPAMTKEEALQCIGVGMEMADAVKAAGFDILGVGEMGIGNTTTSAAILSAVTGEDSDRTCGKGGGINDESFRHKKEIVDRVSEEYRRQGGLLKMTGATDGFGAAHLSDSASHLEDALTRRQQGMIDILAKMGGFDICAMAGVFMGAAKNRMPAVIDGYISVVAALAAAVLAPRTINYMLASHKSWERGYSLAIEILGLEPFLALNMRLGEGSGCPIAFDVIKGACDVMSNMATFEEAAINDDYLDEIRKGDCF
ncbi:MAG: nicotinate-nucleotide--dimethylbenzimidazole phosphoribosyltransferase, partial [Bacillota bacterium]|nr:nicotinate-nucleotide--dimethylbenzimidazole phosphoribosyltransferase [Bacillota bacterium]